MSEKKCKEGVDYLWIAKTGAENAGEFNTTRERESAFEIGADKNVGWLRHALIFSFYFLLRSDIEDIELFDYSQKWTLAQGGDTDTNCCIVGGMIGAYLGIDCIPKEKLDKVLNVNIK